MSLESPADMTEPAVPPMPDGPGVRALKILVVVMGIMMVVGIVVVIGRIVYLANQRSAQGTSIVSSASRLAPQAQLALPAGASIRQVSLSGDRLAVYYDSPSGSGVAIMDLATGSVLSRVKVVPELPQ
jgi:hypothetical protein